MSETAFGLGYQDCHWDDFVSDIANSLRSTEIPLNEHSLTLVTIDGVDDLQARALEISTLELIDSVVDKFKTHAIDRVLFGVVAPGRFCFLHRNDAPLDQTMDWVRTSSIDVDPKEIGLSISRQSFAIGANETDGDVLAAGLAHLVDQFANGGHVPNVSSLSDAAIAAEEFQEVELKAFRTTVLGGSLSIALQPVVRLPDRQIDHYEALARFDPISGGDSPAHYLSLAERAGIIAEFDFAMTQQVLELIDSHTDGSDLPPIAINLSALSLSNAKVLRPLLRLLNRFSMHESRLAFEVTESSNIRNLEPVNFAIQQLRKAGVSVGLDDFGADNADLAILSKLDVDYIKIDGSYIEKLMETPKAKPYLKAITTLCDDLDIGLVAKSVEYEATAAFLSENGIRCAQGFLFGAPQYASSVLMEVCGQGESADDELEETADIEMADAPNDTEAGHYDPQNARELETIE